MTTPVAAQSRTVLSRTIRSVHPLVLLRSIGVTLTVLVATPVLAIAALYAVGAIVGDNLLSSGGQLVAQALVSNVILFGLAGLGLTVATLAVASVNADAHAGGDRMLRRAFPRALAALPRLVLAQLALSVGVVVGVALWAPLVVAALVVALVLWLRGRRAVQDGAPRNPWLRRALLLAIPFAPASVALALVVTAVPASLSSPGSIVRLVRLAATTARSRALAVAAFVVLVGAVTAGFTLLGTLVVSGETDDGALLLPTLLLMALLVAVLVVTGAAYAVLLPPTGLRPRRDLGPRPSARFSGILTRRSTKAASTAIVTIVAVVATLVPTAALAATPEPTATPAAEAALDPETVDPSTLEAELPEAEFDSAVPAAAPAVGPAARAVAPAQSVGYATEVGVVFLAPGRLGEEQAVDIAVTSADAPVGTLPTGTVDVYLDDLDPATADEKFGELPLADSGQTFFLPTDALPAGDATLRFVYVPDNASFAASELSVVQHFDKAYISVTNEAYTPADHRISFGQRSGIDFTVESGRDATGLTLEISRVGTASFIPISTTTFDIVGGSATVSVDLTGAVPVGQHQLYWEIAETGAHGGTGSESGGFSVTTTSTATALTVPDLYIGVPDTLRVAVTGADGIVVDRGTVSFYADNVLVGRAPVVAGAAELRVTRDRVGAVAWRAEYFQQVSDPGFAASADRVTATVDRSVISRPTAAWSGDLTPEDAYLTFDDFIAFRGLPAPTGTVVVTTTGGTRIGSGEIVDGSVRIKASVISGVTQYRAVYSGDAYWSQLDLFVPAIDVAAYRPVVTLSAPTTSVVDTSIELGVAVTNVPGELLAGVDVYRVYPSGGSELVGSVDLNGRTTGTLRVSEVAPLAWGYVAKARFTPLSNVPETSSAQQTVLWTLATPKLTVKVDTAGELAAGAPVGITVTAAELPGGGAGIPSGTVAEVYAGGTLRGAVATVTLTSSASGGLSGTGTFTSPLGGAGQLTAYVTYGSQSLRAASAPVALTVAPPRSILSVTTENVVVGETATAHVRLIPTGAASNATPAQTARITVDGAERYLDLVPALLGGSLVGSYDFFVSRAGDYPVSVSVDGDGVYLGPTTASAVASALKLSTATTVAVRGTAASGQPIDLIPAARQVDAAPFLPVGGTVTIVVSPSLATCTVANDAVCSLPAGSIVAGANYVSAVYSGDSNFFGSVVTTTVTGSSRASAIVWSSSPRIEDAVSDAPIAFGWKVTNTSSVLPSTGRVTVTLGTASCAADVAAGTCSLTVPVQYGGVSIEFLPLSIVFESSDDAADVTARSAVKPRDCLPVTVYNGTVTADLPGSACERRGTPGFLTGSTVTVRPNPIAYPYAFAGWSVDTYGTPNGDAFTFQVTKGHSASFATKYAPVCFTLNLSPVTDGMRQSDPGFATSTRGLLKGSIAATTSPNCSDPRTPTAQDEEEWASGRPRYAMGTEVLVRVSPVNSGFALDTISDTVAQLSANDTLYRTVMDSDKTVKATFRVADCVALDIRPGDGGEISVVSSTRPFDTRYLAPYSGACTTPTGAPGYVPGTEVTLKSTPDAGMFFDAWRTSDFAADAWGVDPLALSIIGDAPRRVSGAGDAHTATYTVPALKDGPLSVGATYSEVRCVEVTVTASWPVGDTAFTALSYTDATGSAPIDSLRCGRGSTAPKQFGGNAMFTYYTQTDWFVGSARVALTAAHDRIAFTNDPMGVATKNTSYATGDLVWGVANPFAEYAAGAGTRGPVLDLEYAADQKLAVSADWYANSCRVVRATLPQGGKLEVRPVDGYQVCAEGSALSRQKIALWVTPQPGGRVLGVLSVVDPKVANPTSTFEDEYFGAFTSASDGRRYWAATNSDVTMPGPPSSTIRVEYCVPLEVNVYVRTANGGSERKPTGAYWSNFATGIGFGSWADSITDNGGCPPLYTRPGASVEVGLTQLGSFGYTITNDASGRGPTVAVGADGTMTTAALYLSANCFSVNRGDRVDADTAPNCPQDGSKYVAGSIVQLQADVEGGETFNGWTGADATDERYAWVAVGQADRSVTVSIDKPSTAQKIGNFFSSVAQRIVAVGATIATGIMLAHMFVVRGIALVMSGVSSVLHTFGVSGADLDRFDRATAIVSAQTSTMEVFANCVGKFAYGQKLTQHSVATQVGGAVAAKAAGLSTEQLQSYLTSRGNEGLSKVLGPLAYTVDIVNGFGSNPDMYFQDAADSWSSMGSSMASCMETDIEAVVKPIIG